MPLNIVVTAAALLVSTILCFAAAAISGSELYLYLPLAPYGGPPPTNYLFFGLVLAIPFVVGFLSRAYGVLAFTVLAGLIFVSSIIGLTAYGWSPSLCQFLLLGTTVAVAAYGHRHASYLEF